MHAVKEGVYDAVGAGDSRAGCCLLVTVLLDAAAPGGASSNRSWAWTPRPQALRPSPGTAPGHPASNRPL